MFFTYIIKNENSGKIYIGQTANLERRLLRHNKFLPNKKSSFTAKNSGSWRYIYSEKYETRDEALRREKWLKSGVGREYIKTVVK